METLNSKLLGFKGIPLIEIPENVPSIGFLEGEFGEAVLEEYEGRVKSDYRTSDPLDILSYKNEIVKGSNSFAVVLVNQIVGEEGLRVARQSDLEKAMKLDSLDLNGVYVDTGLVLRDKEEPDSYLAKDLIRQISKSKLPVMIPLTSFISLGSFRRFIKA